MIQQFTMSVDGRLMEQREPEQIKALLESDTVEELSLTIVPVILGGSKSVSLSGFPGDFFPQARYFKLKEMKEANGAIRLHYMRDRRNKD